MLSRARRDRQVEQRRRDSHRAASSARRGSAEYARAVRLRVADAARPAVPVARRHPQPTETWSDERAGLGVDGLPGGRDAHPDGRRGQRDRQRRACSTSRTSSARSSSTASAAHVRSSALHRVVSGDRGDDDVDHGRRRRGRHGEGRPDRRVHDRRQDRHGAQGRRGAPRVHRRLQRVVRRLHPVPRPGVLDHRGRRLAARARATTAAPSRRRSSSASRRPRCGTRVSRRTWTRRASTARWSRVRTPAATSSPASQVTPHAGERQHRGRPRRRAPGLDARPAQRQRARGAPPSHSARARRPDARAAASSSRQDIAPGTPIEPGMVCTLVLEPRPRPMPAGDASVTVARSRRSAVGADGGARRSDAVAEAAARPKCDRRSTYDSRQRRARDRCSWRSRGCKSDGVDVRRRRRPRKRRRGRLRRVGRPAPASTCPGSSSPTRALALAELRGRLLPAPERRTARRRASPAPTARRRRPTCWRRCSTRRGIAAGASAPSAIASASSSTSRPARRRRRRTSSGCCARWSTPAASACAMEVSSHALALRRVDRMRFSAGAVHQPHARPPRLPRRHGGVLPGQAPAVRDAGVPARPPSINVDDPYGARLKRELPRGRHLRLRSSRRRRHPSRGSR